LTSTIATAASLLQLDHPTNPIDFEPTPLKSTYHQAGMLSGFKKLLAEMD
jgi:hypothetical protein